MTTLDIVRANTFVAELKVNDSLTGSTSRSIFLTLHLMFFVRTLMLVK